MSIVKICWAWLYCQLFVRRETSRFIPGPLVLIHHHLRRSTCSFKMINFLNPEDLCKKRVKLSSLSLLLHCSAWLRGRKGHHCKLPFSPGRVVHLLNFNVQYHVEHLQGFEGNYSCNAIISQYCHAVQCLFSSSI